VLYIPTKQFTNCARAYAEEPEHLIAQDGMIPIPEFYGDGEERRLLLALES